MEKWNENWLVWKEDNAFRLIDLPPADAKKVDLPYDAAFYQRQDPDSRNEGKTGFINGGTWNFYKEYDAPAEERGMEISLHFDGCACNTYVFVNGSLAGSCDYAYRAFDVDISSYLRYGEKNSIRVTTTTLDLSSRFYCGCGIYRDVWICRKGAVSIRPEQLRVTTRALEGNEATVRIDLPLRNACPAATEAMLSLELEALDGRKVWETETPIHLPGNRGTDFSRYYLIPGITPWDDEHPSLYRLKAQLTDQQGQVLDTEETETGFRVVTVDARHGLRVNGRTVKLLGGCIHHDQGILGAQTFDDYEYRRVYLLKQAGFNAVRCAHNPASRALLRACDRLGVYVLDEAFDMWSRMKNPGDYSLFFQSSYHQVLETMVRVDYNHPAVIMYSTGNEIMDLATDRGYELSGEMTAILHRLDETRPVTNAVNALLAAGNRLIDITMEANGKTPDDLKDMDVNQFIAEHRIPMDRVSTHPSIDRMLEYLDGTMDVLGYNYLTERYAVDMERCPDRVILGTETHAPRIADNWRLMQTYPGVIGDFIWTSWSYLGETGGRERFPALHNESCDLDVTGERMPTNYYRRIVLGQRKEPFIAVRTPEASRGPIMLSPWSLTDAIDSWTFPGHEGEDVDVEVYSAGDEVELYLNGASVGRQNASAKRPCETVFRIPYTPGELKAVSLQNGQPVGSYTLSTAGKPVAFAVTQEHYPQGTELMFVRIQAVDAEGKPVFATIPDLTVSLEGEAAQLLAFGSWEAPHNGGYQSPVLSVKNGKALLILRRKNGTEGTMRLRVSAEGIGTVETVLQ